MPKDAGSVEGIVPDGMGAAIRRMSVPVHECYPGAPRHPVMRRAYFDGLAERFRAGLVRYTPPKAKARA